MKLLKCILTENDCYQADKTIIPQGVMIHSTGANNPMLRRYVQPAKEDLDYAALMSELGVNPNGNHWNRPGLSVCVHAFIGRLADGKIATVKTLPWNRRGWHAGNGATRPSANNTHIAFEICEDGLNDPSYFAAVYREAVELTAHLCELYSLDPMKPETVISHSEGHGLGMASNHGDVEHWFPKFGKSMDDFRADVAAAMKGEEERMTQEQFDEMMDNWLARQAEKEPSQWSEQARQWAEFMGLIRGDGEGKMSYKSFCTREELAAIIYRLEHP